ncbi:hypothetical protein J6590_009155 [Homalodisca vitripennis]|nr:hypothetical protein J6590_009155 [Homalodisca vitripennis]
MSCAANNVKAYKFNTRGSPFWMSRHNDCYLLKKSLMEKNTRESEDNKLTEEWNSRRGTAAAVVCGAGESRLNGSAGSPLIVETLCCLLRACDFLNREKKYRQQTGEEWSGRAVYCQPALSRITGESSVISSVKDVHPSLVTKGPPRRSVIFVIAVCYIRSVLNKVMSFRAKKPSLTLNLGTNGLKVASEPPPMTGQAGCLQGQDRLNGHHPSSSHTRRCLISLFCDNRCTRYTTPLANARFCV